MGTKIYEKEFIMTKNYPEHHKHLQELMGKLGKDIPETLSGFTKLHQAAVSDGVLNVKTKELISLAIAIAVRCDGCIAFHIPVSYTHLTLPTILLVQISGVAVSLKKKNNKAKNLDRLILRMRQNQIAVTVQ
eukprot:TRINITY_DN55967_c0_g1_i1.p2 TRINITY_DN55967_c0_g1~~TRINITY_DN55967_c0_g1_i1.p2  ORF type:complete len:132 (-),score=18.03 TRINITY_DN55967_c0_g1_i1:30-425(-)